MNKNILVIGATSSIAEQCLRIWAKQKNNLFIAGRDNKKLEIDW
jgi:short-subunit dehydrogenase